jgi:hypothetical protein
MPKRILDYRVSNSVYNLFLDLPRSKAQALQKKIAALCRSKGFIYEDKDGRPSLIPLMLRPRLLTVNQRNRLWAICQLMNKAYEKAARAYLENPAVRAIFPFDEDEKKWVLDTLSAVRGQPNPIFSRWDANTSFHGKHWVEDFLFFENNGVGIGGVWYCPVAEEIMLASVIPELSKLDARLNLERNHDARILLMKFLERHARALGRRDPLVALAIDRSCFENFIEFPRIKRFFEQRGLRTLVADPRRFELSGRNVTYRGRKIDLIYRDTTIQEFLALEKQGADLRGLHQAFRNNQVISSMGGEFDHKSLFEFFTNPVFSRYFSSAEKRLFARHVLWTRIVREIKTEVPGGRKTDLISFIRKNKADLVLKPNRLFGGEGVLIGRKATRAEWEKSLEEGLSKPGEWVVQSHGTVYQKRFPVPGGRGRSRNDLFYVVSGFISTPDGLAILGRVSKRKVVNVARQGGISAVLVSNS